MAFLNLNKKELPLEATLGALPEPPKLYNSTPQQFNQAAAQQYTTAPAPNPEQNQEFKTIMGALDLINQNQIISHQELKDMILEIRMLVLRHINTNYQLLEVNRMQPLRSEVLQPPLPPLKKPGKKQKLQDPGDLDEEEIPGYPNEYQ